MQSILIIGNSKTTLLEKAHNFANDLAISRFDVTVITKETISSASKSTTTIGIGIVREMQQKVLLRPMQGDKKAVILHDAELLTVEAQNSLLKLLEEPPESTVIMLTTISLDALLPTIISRCRVISLEQDNTQKDNNDEFREIFNTISTLSLGERLKLAERVGKGKDDAQLWLEKILSAGREILLTKANVTETDINIVKQLQEAHATIKTTNTNPRLLLEHYLLSLK